MTPITAQEDFEGRKHIALHRCNTEATLIFRFTAENFVYSVYDQPAFSVVHFNPHLDFEMPGHYLIQIRLGSQHVVDLRAATVELAKKEIADRVLGMIDVAHWSA